MFMVPSFFSCAPCIESFRHIGALWGKLSFSQAISVLREMLRAVSTQEDFELLVTTPLSLRIQYDGKSLQPYHAVLIVYSKWKECSWGKESFSWFASIMALRGGDAFGPAWCRCKFVWIDVLDPIRCFKTQDSGPCSCCTPLAFSATECLRVGRWEAWIWQWHSHASFSHSEWYTEILRNIKNVRWIMVNGCEWHKLMKSVSSP